MSDIAERLRDLSRCNTHLLDGICDCDDCNADRIDACRDAAKEIERLRGLLSLARAYVHANQGGWCRDGVTSDEVLRLTAADQPSAARVILDAAFEITLNANDFFGYACADAVTVDMEHFPKLVECVEQYSFDGVNAFMAWHENCDPLLEHQTKGYRECREKLGPGRTPDPTKPTP